MIDPQDLAALLGVLKEFNGESVAASPNGAAPVDAAARENVDPVPQVVADAIAFDSGDRSDDTYRIVCCCQEAGLSLEQTRWVIDQRADLTERADEFLARNPAVDDIANSYERARARNWMAAGVGLGGGLGDGAAGPGLPPWITAGPGWFFDRTGLNVRDLADAVMTLVMCGYGFRRFYTYDNGVWTPGDDLINAAIVSLLGNRYRSAVLTSVHHVIQHTPGIARITDDPLSEYVNVPNGMVLWRTQEILPHDPVYRSTVQLPVEFVPGADCPLFKKFLREVLPPDLISSGFIWELIAYAVFSGNPFHTAILLHGAGRNGKGTLIRVLKALLGACNCSSVDLYELVGNRFRAAELLGKLANLAGDLDAKRMDNTAKFKAITGEDSINVEEKYMKPFDFTPWALPFYSTNKPFGSADSSEGWMARWIVVPFPNSFTGHEDRELTDKLTSEGELQGILAHAIGMLPALILRGRFSEPQSLIDAKKEFMVASDSLRAWVDEECELNPTAWVPRNQLHHAYRTHSMREGVVSPLGPREFYNRIGQMGGIRAAGRNGVRGFSGIKLKGQPANVSP